MKKKRLYKSCLFLFIIYTGIIAGGCDEPTYQPPGDYISGYVTFVDTNLVLNGGYYAVSVYRQKSQPFDTLPVSRDSLEVQSNKKVYYYRVENKNQGTYYVAVNWLSTLDSQNTKCYVMGTLGCDTAYNCSTYEYVQFPNFTGKSYDILSWTDTSKRLHPPR